MIRAWLARRAERARMAKYKAGWDWAAGRLLEGEAPEDIRDCVCALLVDDWDDGIADACRAWPPGGAVRHAWAFGGKP